LLLCGLLVRELLQLHQLHATATVSDEQLEYKAEEEEEEEEGTRCTARRTFEGT